MNLTRWSRSSLAWPAAPRRADRSWTEATVVALVAVTGAAVVRYLLDPLLTNAAPMLTFIGAVAVAGATCGTASGLIATAVSVVAGAMLFIEPRGELMPHRSEDFVRLALFIIEGTLVALVTGRARRQSDLFELEVERRTAELKASNEALETFAHTISHDVRAPLRSMRGFAEILETDFREALPAEAQSHTHRISAAAHRLEELVNNLLAYTRMGRRALPPERVSLDRVVRAAVSELQPEIDHSHATVTVGPPPLGVVLGHAETIELMISNLLSNAIKYVAPGRAPEVTIRSAQAGGRVRVAVRDNGIGVEAEQQRHIFTAFERLHGRESYPGSGLGLAIVARGAERMNGRYGVTSDGTNGSEFWIELPLATPEIADGNTHPPR
jgi:signal transduction histidine kinase